MHYLEFGTQKPNLLMMHGLTANSHAFDGFMKAGLSKKINAISIDFRGRGLTLKTPFDYSIKSHAEDVMALIDALEIESINLCGHSFGGLLATYLAFYYPTRFKKIIILDAAPKMNPKAAEMLGPALSRLNLRFNGFYEYIEKVKKAPYISFWDEAMMSYYRADIFPNKQGNYETWSSLADITQIAINTSMEPWAKYFEGIEHKTLLIHANENYTMNQQLLTLEQAQETVQKMKNATYYASQGNHQTMLYGENATNNVHVMLKFLA
jgi:pimeloyl-ACP methyl ester carboxylesterase